MKSSSAEILKFHFERKKSARPGFSLRSFAKALNVAPSFVSALLSGKKQIPASRIPHLATVLELDTLAVKQLKRSVVAENLDENFTLDEINQESNVEKYKLVPKSQFSILNPWYNIPIMDLATCANFKKDKTWIATKLGLTGYQVEHSISELLRHGLIKETETGYEKVSEKLRMAFSESNADIRKFHIQMIEKAKEELSSNTDKDSFAKREISGITIPANPKNIAKARERLVEALHDVAEILSEGECTDLYQINTQLFSLLKKS